MEIVFSLVILVRPHVALTNSPSAILNRPENVLEERGPDHVIHLFQKFPAEPQKCKSPSQEADPGPSQGSSRNHPTPIGCIRGSWGWEINSDLDADSLPTFSPLPEELTTG